MGEQSFSGHVGKGHHRGGFLERIANGLLEAMDHTLYAEDMAGSGGLLQRLDPRVKLSGTLLLIVAAVAARSLIAIVCLLVLATTLAVASRVRLSTVMARVWLSVLLFTGLLALPAIFLVPGDVIYRLPVVDWPITRQGIVSAAFLTSRALASASFAVLLILTTSWPHVLKALRVFHVPVVFIVILGMTHRYIFLFLQTAHDMFEARRSRMVGVLGRRETRRIAGAAAGVLLAKSINLGNDVYLAMLARGYRGRDFTLDDFAMRVHDWVALAAYAVVAGLVFWFGVHAP